MAPFASIIGITNQLYELLEVSVIASEQNFPLAFSVTYKYQQYYYSS